MRIIEIQALENGAHRNQTGTFSVMPEGWAVIPDDMETENFPFGDVEVEEIDGVMAVTKWIAGTIPDMSEVKPKPTTTELLIETLYKAGKLTDEEYNEIINGNTE